MVFQYWTWRPFLFALASFLVLVSRASVSENLDNSSPYWTSVHVKNFEGETYHIVYEPQLNWSEAVTSCANAGLVLTSIETKEQLEFLRSVADLPNATNPWIGGSRPPSGGDFTWIANGQVVPSFIWGLNEPNNRTGDEYFMQARGAAGVNDLCDKPLAYICTTKTGRLPTTPQPEETTTEELPEPTTEQETTSGTTTTTRRPSPGICTEPGIIPDPFDCTKYHVCEYNEAGDIWDSVFDCPAATVWCQGSLECQSPDSCPCEL